MPCPVADELDVGVPLPLYCASTPFMRLWKKRSDSEKNAVE